jgi:peptidoglycan/LPS O-acetylase OafA/YrhL
MQPLTSKILEKNIYPLDVLRGLAVLLVMCFHFIKGFSFGWVGVDLFFVLSGFLITGKLAESIHSRNYLSAFYLKRMLRIVPLYYLVLLLFFVVLPLVAPLSVSDSMKDVLQTEGYYWTFSINFWEARNGWPANITLIHFWSLACEIQFYLVWPFVILFVYGYRNARWFLWFLIVAAILFRTYVAEYMLLHPISKYVLLPSRIDSFALGSLAYFYLAKSNFNFRKGPLLLSATALAAILVLAGVFKVNWHYIDQPVQFIGYTLNAIFWAGILVYYSNRQPKPSFILNVFAVVGKYSYAMYVFHLPIWIFLERYMPGNNWIIALSFTSTFLLAYLSYHLFEKYFLRMKPALRHA